MHIDERLNLVVPVFRDTNETSAPYAYVHSSPLSREVFEEHYLLLAKTFAAIYAEGLGETVGPRITLNLLRDIAKRMGGNTTGSAATLLMNEIRRLSYIVMKSPTGRWESEPYEDGRKSLSPDDVSEVENAVAFFIVSSAILPRRRAADILAGAATMWGAQTSFLNATDFQNSLLISTATGNSVEPRQTAMDLPVKDPAQESALQQVY